MAAKGRAAQTAHEQRAWAAWHTSWLASFAFHAPKSMPKLETLTGKRSLPKAQTPNEMKAAFAAWRAAAQ